MIRHVHESGFHPFPFSLMFNKSFHIIVLNTMFGPVQCYVWFFNNAFRLSMYSLDQKEAQLIPDFFAGPLQQVGPLWKW